MDQHTVFTADLMLELTDRFQEWLTFNIAYSTADFNDRNFSFS